MSNLHPIRAQNIDFGNVAKFGLLDRSLSIFCFSIDSYNSLVLRNHLQHRLRISVQLSMNGGSIIRIIKNPHVIWNILLISVVFSSRISFHLIRSGNQFFHTACLVFDICEHFAVVIIGLLVFRDLKLLLKDHLSLPSEISSSTWKGAVEIISFKFKISLVAEWTTSINLTSLTDIKSKIIASRFVVPKRSWIHELSVVWMNGWTTKRLQRLVFYVGFAHIQDFISVHVLRSMVITFCFCVFFLWIKVFIGFVKAFVKSWMNRWLHINAILASSVSLCQRSCASRASNSCPFWRFNVIWILAETIELVERSTWFPVWNFGSCHFQNVNLI